MSGLIPTRPLLTRMIGRLAGMAVLLALAACDSPPPPLASTAPPPPPPPVKQGFYKVGAPYRQGGVWYYPSLDLTYDETGIAALFPPAFQEAQTANGEGFDQNALAAAHKTLPMPSIVQVTNLENGRQIQVRVNDRGSYEPGRIIQLTAHAGSLLGIPDNGLARVRVKIMPTESIQVASLAGAAPPGEGGRFDPLPQASPRGDISAQPLAPPATRPSANAPARPPLVAAAPPPVSPQPVAPQPMPAPPPRTAAPLPLPTAKPAAPRLVAAAPALSETVRTVPVRQTQLFIQGGAFSRSDNAERVKGRLARFGHAEIVQVRQGRETLYRVRLGPIANIDAADKMLSRVITSGVNEAKIVVD